MFTVMCWVSRGWPKEEEVYRRGGSWWWGLVTRCPDCPWGEGVDRLEKRSPGPRIDTKNQKVNGTGGHLRPGYWEYCRSEQVYRAQLTQTRALTLCVGGWGVPTYNTSWLPGAQGLVGLGLGVIPWIWMCTNRHRVQTAGLRMCTCVLSGSQCVFKNYDSYISSFRQPTLFHIWTYLKSGCILKSLVTCNDNWQWFSLHSKIKSCHVSQTLWFTGIQELPPFFIIKNFV